MINLDSIKNKKLFFENTSNVVPNKIPESFLSQQKYTTEEKNSNLLKTICIKVTVMPSNRFYA